MERERFYLARFYSEAVEAAGGAPLHVPLIPVREFIDSLVGRLGGILLPGSASDVDPQLYGREPRQSLGSVHPLRDRTDLMLLEACEERRIPMLGVCYGMQILNVSRGGTLIQDIATEVPGALKHEQGAPRERPSHSLELRAESLLARLRGGESVLVNSHHHQALEVLLTGWSRRSKRRGKGAGRSACSGTRNWAGRGTRFRAASSRRSWGRRAPSRPTRPITPAVE